LHRVEFSIDIPGLTTTSIWALNTLFSKFQFNGSYRPKKTLKFSEAQHYCVKIAHTAENIL